MYNTVLKSPGRVCRLKNERMSILKKNILREFDNQENEDRRAVTVDLKTTLSNEYTNVYDLTQAVKWDLNSYSIKDGMRINTTLIRTTSSFRIRKHTANIPAYYHSHDFYEMLYVYNGKCVQYFYGDETPLKMNSGEACLIAPEVIHAIKPSCKDDLIVKIVIPRNIFETISRQLYSNNISLYDLVSESSGPVFFDVEPVTRQTTEFILTQLLDEMYFGKNRQDSVLHSYLTVFISRFLTKSYIPDNKQLLQQAIKYIQGSFETASIEEFASLLGYSTGHLQRLLREKTDGSFTDIVQRVKVERAAQLLSETDLSIEYIAEKLGYQNPSGLYKIFESLFGMTPGNYRKIWRETGN